MKLLSPKDEECIGFMVGQYISNLVKGRALPNIKDVSYKIRLFIKNLSISMRRSNYGKNQGREEQNTNSR